MVTLLPYAPQIKPQVLTLTHRALPTSVTSSVALLSGSAYGTLAHVATGPLQWLEVPFAWLGFFPLPTLTLWALITCNIISPERPP